MRYITKGNEPGIISSYRTLRQSAGQLVSYPDFNQKEDLNDILRKEQGKICCYCLQSIDHFQKPNEAGSHNEHLIPQQGANGNALLQMDYNNIYACCNYTKDLPNPDSYCGEHKGDELITNFIQQVNCRTFFKYNSIGEILPNGIYETEAEYITNENILPQNQKETLKTIKVLNLNQSVLKKRRADLINQILPLISNISTQQAQSKIQRMINLDTLPPFVEVNIYYLNQV
jgi:uncharacterized protein (TIGR02646 family)